MILVSALIALSALSTAVGFSWGYEYRTREQAEGAKLAKGAQRCAR